MYTQKSTHTSVVIHRPGQPDHRPHADGAHFRLRDLSAIPGVSRGGRAGRQPKCQDWLASRRDVLQAPQRRARRRPRQRRGAPARCVVSQRVAGWLRCRTRTPQPSGTDDSSVQDRRDRGEPRHPDQGSRHDTNEVAVEASADLGFDGATARDPWTSCATPEGYPARTSYVIWEMTKRFTELTLAELKKLQRFALDYYNPATRALLGMLPRRTTRVTSTQAPPPVRPSEPTSTLKRSLQCRHPADPALDAAASASAPPSVSAILTRSP